MTSNLKIINMNKIKNEKHPLKHTLLPNPQSCFRMIIFSPSNSGKSNLIKNMISRSEFGYNTYYQCNIFIFSQTLNLDPIWSSVDLPSTHKFQEWDENLVKNLMKYSLQQPTGILIILDDMIASKEAINNKSDNLLKTLFYQGRHYKISLILVTQKMRQFLLQSELTLHT